MRALVPLLFVALLTLPATVLAQKSPDTPPPPPTHPPASPGTTRPTRLAGQVALGELAPDFELESSTSDRVKLSKLRGEWVLLVFSDRREGLLPLQPMVPEMHDIGCRIVGVAREKPQSLRTIAERDSVTFLLLADFTGEVSAMFGLFDYAHELTEPGFLVIDPAGVVRMAALGQQLPTSTIAAITRFVIAGF